MTGRRLALAVLVVALVLVLALAALVAVDWLEELAAPAL